MIQATSGGVSARVPLSVVEAVVRLASGTLYASLLRPAFVGGPSTYEIVALDPNTLSETNLTQNPGKDFAPRVSPNGEFVAFTTDRNFFTATDRTSDYDEPIVMRRDGSAVANVVPSPCAKEVLFYYCVTGSRWASDGRLVVFVSDPLTIPEEVKQQIWTYTLPSGSGPLLAAPPTIERMAQRVWSIRAGGSTSPNDAEVAFTENSALYVMNVATAQIRQLAAPCAFASTCTTAPVWAANGLAVYVVREATIREYSTGASATRQLHAAAGIGEISASPDGTRLAFVEAGALKIKLLADNSPPVVVFQPIPATITVSAVTATGMIKWSPDSKSLAFLIDDIGFSDGNVIVAVNADGSGRRQLRRLNGNFQGGMSWGK